MTLVPVSAFLNEERLPAGPAVVGAELYVYERGTTNEIDVYDNSAGTGTPVTQPIRSNIDGGWDGYWHEEARVDYYRPHDTEYPTQQREAATGGTVSTDVGYDIILLAGQSNMVGVGTPIDPTYLDTADPRVFQFPGSGGFASQIISGADPLYHYSGAGNVGPGVTFGKLWARHVSVNRDVLLVPTALGNTGFSNNHWNPGDDLYDFAVAQATAAVNEGDNNRVAAIVWVQGEADTGLTASQYGTALDAMIEGLRADIPTADNALFITGSILPEYVTYLGSNAVRIQLALTDAPMRLARVGHALDPGEGYEWTTDGLHIHYNAAGARALGRNLFDAALLAEGNVLNAAPVTPGDISFVQSGTSVTATWERTRGRVTDYKLEEKVNGGSWGTVSHTATAQNYYDRTGLTLGQTYQMRISAVNEEGTSAASTSDVFTLATIPAQVTNLAAPTPASGSMPLTWDAVTGATSYTVEHKKHSDASWTSDGSVTTNSTTVYALLSGTSYDFRVTAVNAAGSGTPSSTLTVSTSAASLLSADVGVSAWGAWSLRNVISGYSGSAIRVRRSSDNTEADIGFDGSGNLDETALLAHCGAGNGFVKTVYDQTGNSRHMTQATTAQQPKIVDSGAMLTQGGRATMLFTAASNTVLAYGTPGLYAAGAMTALEVAVIKSTGTVSRLAESSNTAKYLPAWVNNAATTNWLITDNSASSWVNLAGSSPGADNSHHQVSSVDTGTTVQAWTDAASKLGPTSYTRVGHTVTPTRICIGACQTGGSSWTFPFDGNLSETVAWSSALTTGQRQAGESNQKSYYGTP